MSLMLGVSVAMEQRDALVSQADLGHPVLDVPSTLTLVGVVAQGGSLLAELQEGEVADRDERVRPLRLVALRQTLGVKTGNLVVVSSDKNLLSGAVSEPLEGARALRVDRDVPQDVDRVVWTYNAVPVGSDSIIMGVRVRRLIDFHRVVPGDEVRNESTSTRHQLMADVGVRGKPSLCHVYSISVVVAVVKSGDLEILTAEYLIETLHPRVDVCGALDICEREMRVVLGELV